MPRLFRRIVPFALILSVASAMCLAPALALSTQSEIEMGKAYDKAVTSQSVVETDPLLNAWVARVTGNLWRQTARKDVPYNFKIIRSTDVNAFATLGGYLYVDEGLLDFVQSDDELAGVLGHETGHIERRHVVTRQAKSQALSLLLGVASIFSPLIYHFGNLIQAGIMQKMSRVDELQADQYGLLLMTRAGYDPEAMVTMMNHLGTLQDEHSDLLTRYLQDHPDPKNRVSHLLGYGALDPTKVTPQQKLVQTLHNLDESRYNIATMQFGTILKANPNDQQALLGLGQSELALGETSKSEQTLGEALQKGDPQVRQAAQERIVALRQMETHRVTLTQPNLQSLRAKLQAAMQTQTQAVGQIGARHDQGHDQLKQIQTRLDSISYELPDFSRIDIRPGSKLDAVEKNLTSMSRSINSALSDSSNAINGVGTTDPKTNKLTGLLHENQDVLAEMQAPLNLGTIPSESIAVFPSYPRMFQELAQADGDMVRGVDAGRASALQLDIALGDLDAFIKRLQQTQLNYFNDIATVDYQALVPLMQKADASLAQAAVSASQADQLYNMARSRQLSARISMLGVGTSPQRYATLRKALNFATVGLATAPDYETMLHNDLTPGEIAAATIVAADTKSTPEAIVRMGRERHTSIVDIANERGMHAEALEIVMGIVFLDYTDDPYKESHPLG
ncbi:MAG: M48 family metalloprotease [Candidatus Eremiobacteraeota bacterium]|nr:M48 family metalloprotease [Candidatus Eremiobacteraeota bacterium]